MRVWALHQDTPDGDVRRIVATNKRDHAINLFDVSKTHFFIHAEEVFDAMEVRIAKEKPNTVFRNRQPRRRTIPELYEEEIDDAEASAASKSA